MLEYRLQHQHSLCNLQKWGQGTLRSVSVLKLGMDEAQFCKFPAPRFLSAKFLGRSFPRVTNCSWPFCGHFYFILTLFLLFRGGRTTPRNTQESLLVVLKGPDGILGIKPYLFCSLSSPSLQLLFQSIGYLGMSHFISIYLTHFLLITDFYLIVSKDHYFYHFNHCIEFETCFMS